MSQLGGRDGLTSHTRPTPSPPYVSSMSSPLPPQWRNLGPNSPQPILNNALIPRDYLGALGKSPRLNPTEFKSPPSSSPALVPSPSPSAASSQPAAKKRSSTEGRPNTAGRVNQEHLETDSEDDVLTGKISAPAQAVDFSIARTRGPVSETSDSHRHRADVNKPITNPSSSLTPTVVDHQAQAAMPRTSSIDSAISNISTGSSAPKASTEVKDPSISEIRNLVGTAGGAENLIAHLLRDKAHAASQNVQLWKLVDKQRAMLLGLNKDLERAIKDRDRYRRKAKELAEQQKEHDNHGLIEQSPPTTPQHEVPPRMINGSIDSQEAEPGSAIASVPSKNRPQIGRSPMEAGMMPSPLHFHLQQEKAMGVPPVPVSEMLSSEPGSMASRAAALATASDATNPPKLTSLTTQLAPPSFAVIEATPLSATGGPSRSFSTKRQIAPKPLDLRSSKEDHGLAQLASSEALMSDAEMDMPEPVERGRRKTREEDDREREIALIQEEEGRSRSKKEKRNKSETKSPEQPITLAPGQASMPQRSLSAQNASKEGETLSPPLRSPGLPKSPRPADRPMGSPLPASMSGGQPPVNSLPLSPRSPGFNLSPRAPKQPIPTTMTNIQSAMQGVQSHEDQTGSTADSTSAAISHDRQQSLEPAMGSLSDIPQVYRGLVSPTLPDLLLPPNALPSIQVKVASSRLRPSRFSVLGLKSQTDTSVFSLSIFSRSDSRELWRIEKIPAALPHLEQQIRPRCPHIPDLPDRKLFSGTSPATLDARRKAIDSYFDDLLDTPVDEQSALIICRFLSTDVLDPHTDTQQQPTQITQRSGQSDRSAKMKKNGYLTKKGKNFGGWKSRYFVLDSPELRYFEAPGGAHLGTIKLFKARIGRQTTHDATQDENEPDGQFRHAFLILEPKRKDSSTYVRHVLCAENDGERDEWVTALMHYVEEGQSQSRPATSGAQSSETTNPRSLLRNTDFADAQADHAAKSSSPTLGPAQSGSASPTSSASPPLEAPRDVPNNKSTGPSGNLGLPPRGNIRQSGHIFPTSQQPGHREQKIRNLFQFKKASHEQLTGSPAPSEGRSRQGQHKDRTLVRQVFGLPLAEAVEYCPPEGVDVLLPAVAYRCIEYLRAKKAANEEGLFRLSGSNLVIRMLKERFNNEGDVDLVEEEEYYDVHAVASLFKTYLRELPSTLLTRELHIEFLKVLEMGSKEDRIVSFNMLVHRLPHVNFVLLRALSEYLLEVVRNSDRNKMSVKNVGIVFSPTLNIPAPVFSMFLMEFDAIFDRPADAHGVPQLVMTNSDPDAEPRSPRHQMFTNLSTPNYNQESFGRNAAVPPQQQQHHALNVASADPVADVGLSHIQPSSYESRNYVSIPSNPAPHPHPHPHPPQSHPPQPMYPAPTAPGPSHPHGQYRMFVPDNASSTKAKRRESAMLFM